MTGARPGGLYDYYIERGRSPTDAKLADEEARGRYRAGRAQLFAGARVLEIGPDTGENAAVFGSWGGLLTLVEPNANSHPRIHENLAAAGVSERLERLAESDFLAFESDRRFDLIDAEGVIFTIQPAEAWLARFERLLAPGGFAVINYYERHGAVLELTKKAVLTAVRERLGLAPEDAAERLYRSKWDSIPHTRAFESWVMDVLENPFVRLRFFYDAAWVCRTLSEHGFRLYASWPVYRDPLKLHWHKKLPEPEQLLADCLAHIERSRLGYVLGEQCFIAGADDALPKTASDLLAELLESIDRQIDGTDPALAARCREILDALAAIVAGPQALMAGEGRRASALALLASLGTLYRLIAEGDAEGLVAHCNGDPAFIATWGMPNHFAVMTR